MTYLSHWFFIHFGKNELPPILEVYAIEIVLGRHSHNLDHLEHNISIRALKEWELSFEHINNQTAKTPYVPSFLEVSHRLKNDFRWPDIAITLVKVIRRELSACILDISEVSDGRLKLVTKHDIVRIQVSVADISGVDVTESFENLEEDQFSLYLKRAFWFFSLEEILLEIFRIVVHLYFNVVSIILADGLLERVHLYYILMLILSAKHVDFQLSLLRVVIFDFHWSTHQQFFRFLVTYEPIQTVALVLADDFPWTLHVFLLLLHLLVAKNRCHRVLFLFRSERLELFLCLFFVVIKNIRIPYKCHLLERFSPALNVLRLILVQCMTSRPPFIECLLL